MKAVPLVWNGFFCIYRKLKRPNSEFNNDFIWLEGIFAYINALEGDNNYLISSNSNLAYGKSRQYSIEF